MSADVFQFIFTAYVSFMKVTGFDSQIEKPKNIDEKGMRDEVHNT
jgi:hypothetical protein